MFRFFWTVVFFCLACIPALSQDAQTAEPKHYKMAFENDKVQVVYIHYGRHEKSREHAHPQGVVVNLSEAHLLFTESTGKTREVYAKPGEARWFPAVRHTVENLGETDYDGVYIGVKGAAAARADAGKLHLQLDARTAAILATYLLVAPSERDKEVVPPH